MKNLIIFINCSLISAEPTIRFVIDATQAECDWFNNKRSSKGNQNEIKNEMLYCGTIKIVGKIDSNNVTNATILPGPSKFEIRYLNVHLFNMENRVVLF